MANEIKAVYATAATLDFSVYYDNAGTLTEREADQSMTEQPAGSGVYKGSPATIEQGDIVVIEEGATIIGSAEYYPDANVVEVGGATQTANDNGADINAILVDTAEIGAAGAGLTDLGGMSTGMKAEVNVEADTALSDYDPPTRAELTTDKDSIITEIDANETKIDGIATAAGQPSLGD